MDGDGGGVAQGAIGDAVAAVLGDGALWLHQPTVGALLCALAAGVMSSAVPFLADLLALRRGPARFFGIFMSVNPVFAALIGTLVLDQHLGAASWLAITVIVTANAVSMGTAASRSKADLLRLTPPAARARVCLRPPPRRRMGLLGAVLRAKKGTQHDWAHGAGTAPICCITPRRSGCPRSPTIRPSAR
ncbi:EamA family transporter [Streptomyces sp. NBC_00354]|uniref:EamA family transporter n=1 Tax=Streptomyces sp. NBC_00354 TaxID=2975723 RepID=UPI003FA7DA7D